MRATRLRIRGAVIGCGVTVVAALAMPAKGDDIEPNDTVFTPQVITSSQNGSQTISVAGSLPQRRDGDGQNYVSDYVFRGALGELAFLAELKQAFGIDDADRIGEEPIDTYRVDGLPPGLLYQACTDNRVHLVEGRPSPDTVLRALDANNQDAESAHDIDIDWFSRHVYVGLYRRFNLNTMEFESSGFPRSLSFKLALPIPEPGGFGMAAIAFFLLARR